ncbi:hypothetical protein CC_2916 [Caulobacter vibrioides CB15]|uniref:Uncharacterized protein n=1 Tax=Caulobacter vibrioides (strain ATCC 19089 / CIP 103742 / CB 15) TaxID=190650 RepID=Q9A4C0_CAUVC|nr:hypothetical protein CC_2916 [Caulobacter vibrioides CB15]
MSGLIPPRNEQSLGGRLANFNGGAGDGAGGVVAGDLALDVRPADSGDAEGRHQAAGRPVSGLAGQAARRRPPGGRQLQPPDGTADHLLRGGPGDPGRGPRRRHGRAFRLGLCRPARAAQPGAGLGEPGGLALPAVRAVHRRAGGDGDPRADAVVLIKRKPLSL